MAGDIIFDLYGLLVENIFGSILLAVLALAMLICLIMLIARGSTTILFVWLFIYFLTFSVAYIGGLGLVLGFIGGAMYFAIAALRAWYPSN